MRIVIVGEQRARKALVETLRSLGFFPYGGIEPPSNAYAEAANYRELEQRIVQCEPVDLVFATHRVSYLFHNDLDCWTMTGVLQNVHRGGFARVKIVMFPGIVASVAEVGSEAKRTGIPFLDDPGDREKVQRIINERRMS